MRASGSNAANDAQTDGHAIVSRSWVNPARYDGKLLGDPATIVVSDDQKTAFVMNHNGAIVNAEFLQHGGRGDISVMDVTKMARRQYDDTPQTLNAVYDLGWFGGVGLAILPDVIQSGPRHGSDARHACVPAAARHRTFR